MVRSELLSLWLGGGVECGAIEGGGVGWRSRERGRHGMLLERTDGIYTGKRRRDGFRGLSDIVLWAERDGVSRV